MSKWLGSVSAIALATGMTFGASVATADSLENEIRILMIENPELESLRNQAFAAEEGETIAFAGFLPQIDVSGDFGREHTDSPARRLSNPDDPLELTRSRVTATLRQRLFDGFGTQAQYDSALLSSEVADITLENQTQGLIFIGVRSYLNVLRAMALIDLSTRNVGVIQTQLNLETERVERGSGVTLDELQAKSRLQIAQERKVAFEGALEQAIARYTRIFGHEPELGSMSLPQIPRSELPATLDEAIAVAINDNPQITNSELNVSLADENRNSAQSAFYPTLDLVGRLNWEEDVDGTIGIRRDTAVILEANWQLFAGFANQAGVAQSAYQYVASVNDRSATNRIVVRDTELAWEQWHTSVRRVELLDNAVAIAEEVHASRVKLRDAGQETVLNVLDAENDVFNAQINLVTAQYDGYIGVFRLMQAMGHLTPDRLDASNDQSSLELYDGGVAVAATMEADTVALATAAPSVPEVEAPAVILAMDVVPDEPVAVEIAAQSEAIAWPEPEVPEVAAAEAAPTLETSPEPIESMTANLESFEPEPVTAEPVIAEIVAAEIIATEIVTAQADVPSEPLPEPMEVTTTVEIIEPVSEPVDMVAEVVIPEQPVVEPEPNAVAQTMLVSTADLEQTSDLNLTRAWGFD
jgi:adhesin transport system outer membrane protein